MTTSTSNVAVVSRATVTNLDLTVTGAYGGSGNAVSHSSASTSAKLTNLDSASDLLYKIDSGSWVTLGHGLSTTFDIDFSSQALRLKLGEQSDGSINATIEIAGEPSGLYAGSTSVATAGGGGDQGISSPLDIPNCILWLDATDATTINAGSPTDGDQITAWTDKSTGGHDADGDLVTDEYTADNRPTFVADWFGGFSGIAFDPSVTPRFLKIANKTFLNGADGATILFLAASGIDSGGYYFWASTGTDKSHRRLSFICDSPGGTRGIEFNPDDSDNDINYIAPHGAPPDDFDPTSVFVSGSVAATTAVGMLATSFVGVPGPMIDAIGVAREASSTLTGPITDADCVAITIGADPDGNSPLAGTIGAIIAYDRALNAAEQRQLLEWASSEWGYLKVLPV